MERVSMSQPRIRLTVDHEASPLSSFLTEAGSVRVGASVLESGRKTESMECVVERRPSAREE